MNLFISVCVWLALTPQKRHYCAQATSIYCYNEFECANSSIVADASINDINCLGRGSCAGGMINNIGTPAIGTTACWGSRSCQSVSVLNGTVLYPADLRSYLSLA